MRIEREISVAVCLLALVTATPILSAGPQPQSAAAPHSVTAQIKDRIESVDGVAIVVGSERILAHQALPEFYRHRDFQPAWSNQQGPLLQARRLVNSIHAARHHGLAPENYHLRSLEQLLGQANASPPARSALDPSTLAELDLLLTDAFLVLGSHLLVGRVDPTTIDAEWFVDERRRADLLRLLSESLAANRVEEALSSLPPQQEAYAHLKEALRRYRAIAASGGWPPVADGPKLETAMRDTRVLALRERLLASGDLPPSKEEPTQDFDLGLAEAVRSFQSRHGLDPDGVVGPATLAALNVPVQQRVRQIELNLERWRWLPDRLGERYLLVNIPSFELTVFEGRQPVLSMRVVVGRPYRRTPVFSAEMTYLVLSPYWNVPPNIAALDIVPAVQKDPNYLATKHIKVFQGWGADAREIDPSSIDWSKLGRSNLPYHFRQEPGPLNALGDVKFMFPNPHNVYLHDTPSRELFARPDRTFSSGCIRIEKPIDLAEYLLREDSSWNRERISSAIEKRTERTVRLPRTIPVHLEYWTSFSDANGTIHFRTDVYGRDSLLDAALREDPPKAGSNSPGV